MAETEVGLTLPPELWELERYTVSGYRVLEKLYRLASDVLARDVEGDIVECGVCNGGSAAAMACALRGTARRVWLYDSFEGLPEPKSIDGADARAYMGACVGTEGSVKEAMAAVEFPDEQCLFKKGWFQDTLRTPGPETIALLHVDADWYDSVLLCLNRFYDAVSEGGVVVLDDFGHWEGCRYAFYDFIGARGLRPLLERFGHTQAFWVKGREHNRDFRGQWEIP